MTDDKITDRIAELIEKAAQAIDPDAFDQPNDLPFACEEARSMARAALAVFEEALVKDLATSPGRVNNPADSSSVTPTDDEWEPPEAPGWLDTDEAYAWQSGWTAGHRTVQGDPTLRDHVRNLTGASDAELDALGGFTGELSNVSEPGVSDISPTQMSVKGEPSDAQVRAAWKAFNESESGVTYSAMRAALRAAAAVQGGENDA